MSIETNILAGKPTKSWTVYFAETSGSPDGGWKLIEPTANTVDTSRMTACPAVRYYTGWYYVATTTEGSLCPAAGWAGTPRTAPLCVIVYRSKTLKSGSWVVGNGGQAIVAPGDSGPRNDRKVMAPWKPTAAELDAIHGHAPSLLGNINDSDFDFCDAPGAIFYWFSVDVLSTWSVFCLHPFDSRFVLAEYCRQGRCVCPVGWYC